MAISLRLATRIFLMDMRYNPGQKAAGRWLRAPVWAVYRERPALRLAEVPRQMAHVVAGRRCLGEDVVGRLLARLAQRPQGRRARARAAIAEHRSLARRERRLGALHHVRGHPLPPERDVVVDHMRGLRRLLYGIARRLVGRFPVRAIVDDGGKTLGLEDRHIGRADLR